MEDFEVWESYPHLRDWFDKLRLSLFFDYNCGPCGVAPRKDGWYIVRPIYNLGGMGVGARKVWIQAGDATQVEPGYFWCEYFEGDQYSITYNVEGFFEFNQKSCWKAVRGDHNELYKFDRWERSDFKFDLPYRLEDALMFDGLTVLNVEVVGGKIIEIHFRDSPDPDYDVLVPIWKGEEHLIDILQELGYTYINAFDNSNGFLPQNRLGFMTK